MNSIKELYINQIGYKVGEEKYFLTTINCDSFSILDSNNEVKYSGRVEKRSDSDKSTGERIYIGKFTDFDEIGEYKINLNSGLLSDPFKVGEEVFNDLLFTSLKSFYFQRCGSSLEPSIVGDFSRKSCHSGPTEFHPSTGLKGTKDVSGGWHDAGDYGRYITPASVTLGIMMLGYEHFNHKFNFNHLGLSDKSINNDFLGEIRYELEWMLKMQETDETSKMFGACHYMVNSNKYTWNVPENDMAKQYILDYCSRATADFAATMAVASRLFADIDIKFSEKALDRSLLAWKFITENGEYPKGGFKRPETMMTGGYADSPKDNKFDDIDYLWPATELFITTGDDRFTKYIKDGFKKRGQFTGGMNWMNKTGFPEIQYALSKAPWVDGKLQKVLLKRIKNRCNGYLKQSKQDGFFVSLKEKEYLWGSNGEVLARALELILASIALEKSEYKDAALKQLNYILGLNINSFSYVAGIGSRYPKNIHHASFENDGIDRCFPGIMAGGPNRRVHLDKILKQKFKAGTPGAKCYIDHSGSYSSNENCITYSAPLIPVAAFFSNIG